MPLKGATEDCGKRVTVLFESFSSKVESIHDMILHETGWRLVLAEVSADLQATI